MGLLHHRQQAETEEATGRETVIDWEPGPAPPRYYLQLEEDVAYDRALERVCILKIVLL